MLEQMKACSWLLQADGSFKAVEIPSPPGFDSWLPFWRVYRSFLLMLGRTDSVAGVPKHIVTGAALEEYVDRIQEYVDLTMQAQE